MKTHNNPLLKRITVYTLAFFKWLLLGLTVGGVCGLIGAAFSKLISYGINLREHNNWIILLLPPAGIISVLIYKLCRTTDIGTNRVFESVRGKETVPMLLAPAVFIGTILSHTFGASAGREGAALQLGGSISSLLAKMFRLDEKSRHILTMCGMASLFSALFGTPLGAAVFALEVVSVGSLCSAAFFPCIISSISAYYISASLGIQPERFVLQTVPDIAPLSMWKVMLIGLAGALVSILFCKVLHETDQLFKKLFRNEILRVAVGGTIIIILTCIVGSSDYNGGGIEVIERIFSQGEVRYEAFALKILFTAVSIAAGYKGGEIIPTMFIGATLGGTLASLMGMDVGLGAAIGIAALFCGVTNCPLGTIVLCIELFGAEGMVFYALAGVISFMLSGKSSLYSKQHFVYSKLKEEIIDIDADKV